MDSPLIDWSRLEQLRTLQKPGRPDVVRQLVHTYLSNSASLLDSLDDALARADAQVLVRAAHSLKSTTATIGAEPLAALAAELEHDFRAGRFDGAETRIGRFRVDHAQVTQALRDRYLPDAPIESPEHPKP